VENCHTRESDKAEQEKGKEQKDISVSEKSRINSFSNPQIAKTLSLRDHRATDKDKKIFKRLNGSFLIKGETSLKLTGEGDHSQLDGSQNSSFTGILRDDILGFLYRCKELDPQGNIIPQFGQLKTALNERSFSLWLAITVLRVKGAVIPKGQGLALTNAGAHHAQNLVRSHRLWETYLVEKMGLSPDHVHNTAEQLEHITDKEMRDQLAKVTANQSEDPHHSQIPPEEGK
jgi:iron dependent repressor-like protein